MKLRRCAFAFLLFISFGYPIAAQSRFSFEQLVASALENNAELRAIQQRQQETAGLLRQAGLQPNPSIEVAFGNGTILGSRGDYDFSITYAHTFERGNKRNLRIATNEPGVAIAKLEVADRARVIRAEIAEAYVDALAAQRALETLGQLSKLNQEYLRVAEARVNEGEAAPIERGLLQVEFSRIETDRLRLEADSSRALIVLKNLAGLKLDSEILLEGALVPDSPAFNIADLIQRAISNRPDIQAVKLEEQARSADFRLAQAEAISNAVGFARYSYSALRFDQLGLNASGSTVPLINHENMLTGGISFDLKTRNRNQGEIEAAMAREQASKYRTASLTQQIEREVRAAAARYEAARKTTAVFNDNLLNQSQANVNAIRAAYEIGELRVFDLLSEQRRLIETQRSYIDALRELSLSRFELERAVGGPLQ